MAARELKFERPHNRRRSRDASARVPEGDGAWPDFPRVLCQFAASLLLRRRLQPQARPCSQGGWSPRTSTPTTQSILSISAHQSVRNAAEEDARRSSKRRKYQRKKHHGEADANDTEAAERGRGARTGEPLALVGTGTCRTGTMAVTTVNMGAQGKMQVRRSRLRRHHHRDKAAPDQDAGGETRRTSSPGG